MAGDARCFQSRVRRSISSRGEENGVARPSLGVVVIGAGMAGRAHAAGYRSATTGYERSETNWQAIADAADIDARAEYDH